ncbi:site-specific integrase [Paenisporosarcina sp. OV554]|uniref:site-specific integrase n=1 Tax=Paenisporosarcina sp. OV554 TaxID=2135694 RepID=UPI000D39D3A4|nr:site-specific integrase [Paenisporosarcina sp. OV554]PUB08155.1 phage integrase family protein [Paenisporosarcina sp. OV554]
MKLVQPIRDKEKIAKIKDILQGTSTRDWFMFVMGINTGLRISDMLQLKVEDVKDKTHIIIKDKKTGKEKRYKINDALREAIEYYVARKRLKVEGWLFPSRMEKDKPITREQAYKILSGVSMMVGLEEIGTLTLRKTFGYHFYQETKDVTLLQEIFNHSEPSVTLRYIGIIQDVLDPVVQKTRS